MCGSETDRDRFLLFFGDLLWYFIRHLVWICPLTDVICLFLEGLAHILGTAFPLGHIRCACPLYGFHFLCAEEKWLQYGLANQLPVPAAVYVPAGTAVLPRLPSDEERLLEMLFEGYNPSARPVINSSRTVDVQMQFALLQIQELVGRLCVWVGGGGVVGWCNEHL